MKVLLFLLAVVVLAATAYIAHTVSESPHAFSEDECQKCHIDASENPKAMRTSITTMCQSCHRKLTKNSSHPVDTLPELVKVPADLPLSNGRITCNTCHNIHENRFSSFGSKTYFLRRPVVGRDFCLSCHQTKRSLDSHIEMVSTAHLGSRYTVTDQTRPLDPMSMECISCHDGNIGRAASFNFGEGVWSHDSGSHPIGVNYRESRMRKGGLQPVSMLDRKLRLFSGRIGCGTCHDMYSKLPKKLATSNATLCTSCHDK